MFKHEYNYFSCASDLAQQLEIRQGLPVLGDFSYFIKIYVNLGIFSWTRSIEIEQLSEISKSYFWWGCEPAPMHDWTVQEPALQSKHIALLGCEIK